MNASLARASILSSNLAVRCAGIAVVMVGAALWTTDVRAQVLAMTSEQSVGSTAQGAMSPADSAAPADVTDIPVRLRRQRVDYSTTEAPGTIVVDTPNTYLYFVLGGGKAIRYGIGVGRDGFTWSGAKTIERKSEWPDWLPPADMLRRQPYLPRFMAGTNKPSSIGKHVSSGCIRMLNEDVIDLYGRTHIGTRVVALPMDHRHIAQTEAANGFAQSLR